MRNTCILLPMVKDDGRQEGLKKYKRMKESLEFGDFGTIDEFLMHHNVHSNEHYLNIIRAGISRPMEFMKRTIQQKWTNNFNPWVAKVLNSNMDTQLILEEYSCAMYIVEYVNKTNRGMSSLQ